MTANVCKILKLCADCGQRKALFRSKAKRARRHLHTDRRHNLCAACQRNRRNALDAGRLPLQLAAAVLLCLLLSLAAAAQATTVIGNIKDLTGDVVPGGQVTLELRPGADTTISGNGRFTPATVTCAISQSNDFSSTGVVRAANVVTVTFTQPHGFIVGDVVTVSSMTDTSFNGTFTIATVADTSHVTWAQTGSNASTGAGIISALRRSPGVGSCTVTQNTALQPAGTSYNVCLWPLGAKTSCFNWYAIGAGPVDLSTAVPTPAGLPSYAFVDLISTQTITGSKTFAGPVTFQSTVVLPTSSAISGIFSTTTGSPATAGTFRSANNENGWCARNAANSANLCLILDATNTLRFNGSALGTGGTVTSFSAGTLSPLFTTSVATGTTTPALTFAPVSQSAHLVFASPCGGAGNPSFRVICGNDISGYPGTTSTVFRGDGSWIDTVTGNWNVGGDLGVTGTATANVLNTAGDINAGGTVHITGDIAMDSGGAIGTANAGLGINSSVYGLHNAVMSNNVIRMIWNGACIQIFVDATPEACI